MGSTPKLPLNHWENGGPKLPLNIIKPLGKWSFYGASKLQKPWFIGRPFRQVAKWFSEANSLRSPSHRETAKWTQAGAYVQLKRGALGSLWLWHLPVFQEASVVNPGERYRKICGFPHRTVGLWCLALQHVHSHLLGQGLSPQIEMKTRKTYEKMQKHEPTRPFLCWSCPKKCGKKNLFRMFKTWIQPRLKLFCISDAWMFDEFLGDIT